MNDQPRLKGSGKFIRRLAEQQERIERLRPGSAPGILTSHTTHGVTRQAINSSQSTSRTSTRPRWG